ncbi:DNA-binding protein [Pseudomonas guariconensis]|uniref:DNA-binding protein n=1 Tax=Pseudomonas guariconensis TaxID=1288410 RepID=UPI0018ABF006|nr:DNA-binding protein [Pseudomonas guariconensis]MBF8757235.1 DNA-binding protein [Pseudomonas guariconensis]
MARVGINKVVVQQARQALLARGEHPSIDAVRIELGNTGSKTTIHRYLKELEEHPPAPLDTASLSSQLSGLVEQLAEQLNDQAQARIRDAEADFEAQREQLQAQVQLAQQALAAAHHQLQIQASALQAESEKLLTTQSTLQAEQLRSASLNQALGEVQLRLADKDAQVQQLQVELRQLQQGMLMRQEEATRLHRDNERLIGEHRQAMEQRTALEAQLEQRDAQVQGLRSILAQAQGASDEMRRQLENQTTQLEHKRELCGEQARQLERLQGLLDARTAALGVCEARLAQVNGGP